MARRRMVTRTITGTVDFLEMPKAAQALYLQLVSESDDDGITDCRPILKVGNFRKRDLEVLLKNDYVRMLDEQKSVIWVTDWQDFNTVKTGQGTPSVYREYLLRAVPDIKNALFTPKTGTKKRQSGALELESELEEKRISSRVSLDEKPATGGNSETNKQTDKLISDSVEHKLMAFQKWKPETVQTLTEKFLELNPDSETWNAQKLQRRIDGFVASERTPADFAEWHRKLAEEQRRATIDDKTAQQLIANWVEEQKPSEEDKQLAADIWRQWNQKNNEPPNWVLLSSWGSLETDEEGTPYLYSSGAKCYADGRTIENFPEELQ